MYIAPAMIGKLEFVGVYWSFLELGGICHSLPVVARVYLCLPKDYTKVGLMKIAGVCGSLPVIANDCYEFDRDCQNLPGFAGACHILPALSRVFR